MDLQGSAQKGMLIPIDCHVCLIITEKAINSSRNISQNDFLLGFAYWNSIVDFNLKQSSQED